MNRWQCSDKQYLPQRFTNFTECNLNIQKRLPAGMAESFGIVAGGIRAVSLAVQITEQTRRLRKFLKSIKDAPNETEELLNELDFLANASKVFEDIKNHEASQIGSNSVESSSEISSNLQKNWRTNSARKAILIAGKI